MNDTPTIKSAKAKAAKYCAYQERTQQQLRDKLFSWGLYGDDVEEVILFAITEGFVNEERYARSYCSGHFILKKWGRIKIKNSLQQKNISSYCIDLGLQEIDEEDYLELLKELATKKYEALKDQDTYIKKQKTARYLMQKGFESELIWSRLSLF